MATVGGAAVEVGDWLRCDADDWEGQVTEVNDDDGTVMLRMSSGDVRAVAADRVFRNWWDPGAVAP